MRFEPKTADEIAADALLAAGTYPFEVLRAADKFSKAGNEIIELKLGVYDGGDCVHVFDYLLEKLAYKLRNFAETTGQLDKYEKGELLAADCEGKTGFCKVIVDVQPGYSPKNAVKDYLLAASDDKPVAAKPTNPARPTMTPAHKASMAAQMPDGKEPFSDDIPF